MTPPPFIPARGEVWLVNLDPTFGDEIRKQRPAVVMSRDALCVLALRAVVPFTDWRDKFRISDWLVRIDPSGANGLDKISAADTFQVRSVSVRRFVRHLGCLGAEDLERIADGLKAVFDL